MPCYGCVIIQLMSTTVNPLHFEDLEPKRFEDLTRQLIYDYRTWGDLEATGRSGGDGGFDVRAWEKVANTDEDEEMPKDRPWLVQCKRELEIGPKKARGYAKDITANNPGLYGVLFVASCDLSRKTRDAIREELGAAGVQEIHIWGRSEIEDQLFQPKNDHLLFGYFGFSLTRRRSSIKTKVRSKLATKRKVDKLLGAVMHGPIMVRDADFEDYPFDQEYQGKENDDPPIIITSLYGTYYNGILILIKRYHAFFDEEKKEFDFDPRYNQAHLYDSIFTPKTPDAPKNRMAFFDFHRNIHYVNRYHYVELGFVPYDSIIDIDEKGDEYFRHPHIYIQRSASGRLYGRPRLPGKHLDDRFTNAQLFDPKKYKRIKVFPKVYRSKKQPPTAPPATTSEVPFPGA